MTVVYIFCAFIIGGCCGVVLASILAAAGRADEPFQDLPGSRSSSGGPGTRALREPGSTVSGAIGSGHEAALGRPRSEKASPLKIVH